MLMYGWENLVFRKRAKRHLEKKLKKLYDKKQITLPTVQAGFNEK
jgi:hypothetical protein